MARLEAVHSTASDEVTFGGGYPNDDGVNLMHDVSPAGSLERITGAK